MAFPRRYSLLSLSITMTIAAVAAAWLSPQRARVPVQTDRDLDLCIQGEGMFVVMGQDGGQLYSRSGSLSINQNGELCLGGPGNGLPLEPCITVPGDWTSIQVSPDGMVSAQLGSQADAANIGRIQLAKFINPDSLTEAARGLFKPSSSSGPVTLCSPGSGGAGLLQQGWLERGGGWPIEPESIIGLIAMGLGVLTLLEVRRIHHRLDKLQA